MRKVVLVDGVFRRVDQNAGVPDPICLAMPYGGLLDVIEENAAAPAVFAPAEGWVVKVIREVAAFHPPACSVLDLQTDFPSSGVQVPQANVGNALGTDCDAAEV